MRLLVTLLVFTIVFTGCDDNSSDSTENDQFKLLIGQWNINHVSVNNRDVTGSFENLQLTIHADKSFSVVNSKPHIWPASGSFSMRSDDLYQLLRHDGIYLRIDEVTSSSLKLVFAYSSPSGRVNSISGSYTFVFRRRV